MLNDRMHNEAVVKFGGMKVWFVLGYEHDNQAFGIVNLI